MDPLTIRARVVAGDENLPFGYSFLHFNELFSHAGKLAKALFSVKEA